ncbi:hypothetical protein AB6735_13645 [Mucilaginibacter sp. RCC_168]|uniref:hypothetical protein n=1 Tax=Mucilaginibacter sp. RCC_168 TaxID=3239221 RepID=UPI0035267AEC
MNNYKNPGKNQQNNNKETRESTRNIDTSTTQSKNNLEKQGPDKKNLNVLNEDGSLADLPDQEVEGRGALDGTIGK